MNITDKIPSIDTETPVIEFDWKQFKDCTKVQRLAILNFICWIAHMYRLITVSERKKIYDRTGKAIQETLRDNPQSLWNNKQ